MNKEKGPTFEAIEEVNLGIRDLGDEYRILEFDSQDPKLCEAYIAAIADVLSGMWPNDDASRPAHIKEILLEGHFTGGKIQGGYFSFPLHVHEAVSNLDDKVMLDRIHAKAIEIYRAIAS